MNRTKAKNWPEVLEYAQSIRDGRKIACDELKQAVERFFHDLDNPDYWMDHKAPEFCIGVIEKTLCHQQGNAWMERRCGEAFPLGALPQIHHL